MTKQERQLSGLFKVAKSKITFNPTLRTWKTVKDVFGVAVEDETKPLTLKELEEVYEQEKQRLADANSTVCVETDRITESSVASVAEDVLKSGNAGYSTESARVNTTNYRPSWPTQRCSLLPSEICPQKEAAQALYQGIEEGKTGQLLLAQTGAGKTFILGSVNKNIIENLLIQNTLSPWPIIYVTKASVVQQTEQVLEKEFGINVANDVHVINIELLRSKLGSLFVKEEVTIVQGQEHTVYTWNRYMHPIYIFWDECQVLARDESIQSKIAQAVNNIETNYGVKVYQIFSSATPFARVSEAKCFAVSTGLKFKYGNTMKKLTNETWPMFARDIASPWKPEEYSEEAVANLTKILEPYIVRVTGIKPKHKAFNKTEPEHFPSPESKLRYEEAWAKFQEEKAKLEGQSDSYMQILAQLTIFGMAAEKEHAPGRAAFIVDSWNKGLAPVVACRFKGTIVAIYKLLIEKYGWTREDVSLIWGGSNESVSTKKKLGLKLKHNESLIKALEEEGLSLDELGFDAHILEEKSVEQQAFEKLHRLTSQKPDEREQERLHFQRQDSKCCLFTFKSGGVGLSLHHEPQFIRARPRIVELTPVYSEKELIQGLGRCPRITSMSDTYQTMRYFIGTIEEHIASRVTMKLKCVWRVTQIVEDWQDVILGYKLFKPGVKETSILDGVDNFEANNMLQEYAG